MAAPRRKKTTRRRGASRGRKQSAPAYQWFLAGVVIGLGIAGFLFFKGYLPDRSVPQPVANTSSTPTEELVDNSVEIASESTERQFDFFTVLPEMEVVVPEQDLRRDAQPSDALSGGDGLDSYILQVASFQSSSDAEQMKARLALRGHVASIQVVTVNDATWHRVRIGPVQGARRADEIHRLLQDEGIPNLVMKANPGTGN